jgi:RimJ/RimL family protein N-acetyltransferase
MTIHTQNQDVLATWLCNKIGLVPSPHLRCIARLNAAGQIMGVVGYDGYNGASCLMHVAGEGNWISRDLLRAAFDYPFNVMQCQVVLGMVPSGNVEALKLNEHLGFKVKNRLYGAHPDGSLVLMMMTRDECRWLRKSMAQVEHALLQ